jgi:hypothetical protein
MTLVHFLPCYRGLNPSSINQLPQPKGKRRFARGALGKLPVIAGARFLGPTAPDAPKR